MPQNTNEEPKMRIPEAYTNTTPASNGPVIGVLVIILLLVLGGLYLWGTMATQTPVPQTTEETDPSDTNTEATGEMSTSDELGAIEADLSNTDMQPLSDDLVTVEVETNAIFAE